jgi:hypothetical protein
MLDIEVIRKGFYDYYLEYFSENEREVDRRHMSQANKDNRDAQVIDMATWTAQIATDNLWWQLVNIPGLMAYIKAEA